MSDQVTTSENVPLRYVAGVSWPRSSHHLLVRLMSNYFGDQFNYCEFYTEQLDCCRQFPCARANSTTFSKNHDFDLAISDKENVPYLIQYRTFFNSVVSEFELHIRAHGENSDNKESFNKFSQSKARQYKAFKNKWVDKDKSDSVLLVPFEDLIENTPKVAAGCVRHFSPGCVVDEDKLSRIIDSVDGEKVENRKIVKLQNVGVHQSRDFRSFRYFDDEWFDKITDILSS